jgi:peptidoglycan L-alanyl-D-glutamate endopeptidase CwlK
MSSRKIEDLHKDLQPLATEFMRRCDADGLHVFLVCTYRSGDEQNALYDQGRTKPGAIVTRARAGQSAHNNTDAQGKPAAKAFDIGVLLNGKYDGEGKSPDWQKAGKIGMDLGLNWYGAPSAPFREMPHFQLKG